MFISQAYAATTDAAKDLHIDALAAAPSATEAFLWNIGLVVLLVIMFYVLLIMPQQRRFREHSAMLNQLKPGDKVVTGGGLVGKIDSVIDENEVVVDLGHGVKVTALRSMIQGKADAYLKPDPKAQKPAAKDPKKKK